LNNLKRISFDDKLQILEIYTEKTSERETSFDIVTSRLQPVLRSVRDRAVGRHPETQHDRLQKGCPGLGHIPELQERYIRFESSQYLGSDSFFFTLEQLIELKLSEMKIEHLNSLLMHYSYHRNEPLATRNKMLGLFELRLV